MLVALRGNLGVVAAASKIATQPMAKANAMRSSLRLLRLALNVFRFSLLAKPWSNESIVLLMRR